MELASEQDMQQSRRVSAAVCFSFALAHAIALEGHPTPRFGFARFKNSKPVWKVDPRRLRLTEKVRFWKKVS